MLNPSWDASQWCNIRKLKKIIGWAQWVCCIVDLSTLYKFRSKKKRNNIVHERPKRTIGFSRSIDLKLNNFSFVVQAYDTLLSCQSIMAYVFIYPSICDLCFGNLLRFELKYYFWSFWKIFSKLLKEVTFSEYYFHSRLFVSSLCDKC
jgi:hypothetical protein